LEAIAELDEIEDLAAIGGWARSAIKLDHKVVGAIKIELVLCHNIGQSRLQSLC